MPPPESDILTAYLLLPAPLPSITTLDQFRALFPRSLQTNPQVPRLYRDLQAQRNGVVDAVAQNIGEEARRGVAMRREVLRALSTWNLMPVPIPQSPFHKLDSSLPVHQHHRLPLRA
ncbi:hypothetical protein E4U12_006947, partial [Claviceps purpurea]